MSWSIGKNGRVLLLAASMLLVVPSAASSAGCGLLGLSACPPPSEPRQWGPDPGGADLPDQPVPVAGKVFGFNTQLWHQESSPAIVDFEVEKAAAVGANVQRTPISWEAFQQTESSRPLGPESVYQRGTIPTAGGLRQLDRLYDTLTARGMRLVLIVDRAPKWASPQARCEPFLGFYARGCEPVRDGRRLYPSPGRLSALRAFAVALGERYPNVVLETWNEPQLDVGPGDPSGAFLGEMTCAVHQAAKSLPTQNLVLSPAFGKFKPYANEQSETSTRNYLNGFYSTGTSCYDVFSLHTYTRTQASFGADGDLADNLRIFRGLRAEHADTTPIWVTEFGFTTTGATASQGGYSVSQSQQADLTRREYNRLMTLPDVQGAIVHTLRDRPEARYSASTSPDYGYGWLEAGGAGKPVYCEFLLRRGRSC